MKIMIVNTYYFPEIIGGAEISVQKLAEGLYARGHDVYVLCSSEAEKEECINGVHVIRISRTGNTRFKRLLSIFDFLRYKKVKGIVEAVRPDIIHTNNLMEISYSIWTIGYREKIPMVHTLRDYGLISGKPYAVKLKRRLSKAVTGVTAPSGFTLQKHIALGCFPTARVSRAIFNATEPANDDREIFEHKIKYGAKQRDRTRFAYIGRFEENKGILWLIKTFAAIGRDDIELHLFGKGSLSEAVEAQIKGDRRITCHGFLEQKRLMTALREIDVVIVPSLWEEPFGRVILDAYVQAIPVIVTQRGGMPEIVEDYKTGRIIPCTDQALTEAIAFFCDEKNIRMTLRHIENILPRFSIQTQVKEFEALYQKMM